jgi:hypothetical protein
LKTAFSKLCLVAILTLLVAGHVALAQEAHALTPAMQSAATALASLPDADVLLYVSPQRILNEAAPKFMPATELTKMRAQFADLKKSVGVDPSTIEYLVIAVRFHKPAADLSFVAPDVLAVAGGDFSADSLFTLAQLYAQDKARSEKHGSKTMLVMKIDPIAEQAAKTPLLKSLVEMGLVPLNANTIAIGNLPYLQAAIDASEGAGRINPATLQSLLRDPNVLLASTGAPLGSFAKAFGMYGTETTPRDSRCETPFGNFYSAVTVNGTNLSLRGAMNADNPDTAKIISSLLAGLMKQGIDAVPDKEAQTLLQTIKLTPKENEIVWEADIPDKVITDWFASKPPVAPVSANVIKSAPQTKTAPRRPIRKKRPRPQ